MNPSFSLAVSTSGGGHYGRTVTGKKEVSSKVVLFFLFSPHPFAIMTDEEISHSCDASRSSLLLKGCSGVYSVGYDSM